MNSRGRDQWIVALAQGATVVVAVLMAGAIAAPKAEARARAETSECAAATYVIRGKPLIRDGAPVGEDAVVLEVDGETDGPPRTIAVRSGCPPAPLESRWKRGRLIVEGRLDGCAGIDGSARLRARVDASCRTMSGRFSGRLASKGAKTRRRFSAERDGGAGGRVVGQVSARHGGDSVRLVGARVFLVSRTRGTRLRGRGVSDADGRFDVAVRRWGEYDVCISGKGLPRTCGAEPVTFAPEETRLVRRDLEVVVTDGAVHGRVLLRDGTPCFHAPTPLDAGVAAVVSRDGHDRAAAPGDSGGRYLLTGIPGPGTYTFRGACGGARVEKTVTVAAEHLTGAQPVDLDVPNAPPSIDLLAAWRDGRGVRTAPPGSAVDVAAQVEDPDGDRLRYVWADEAGAIESGTTPTKSWTLQGAPSRNVLTLLVTDDRGGYAKERLVVRAGTPVVRFAGTVQDVAGTPLANATVTVGDQSVHTDEQGNFRLKLPDAERYVVTARAPGHAPYSRPFEGDAIGLDIVLKPARLYTFAEGADVAFQDGPDGPTVRMPADAIVDAAGNPPKGPLVVEAYTYDGNLGEFPGDRIADTDAGPRGLMLQTCLWLKIVDPDGTAYDLAPGRTAELSFKVPAALGEAPPDQLVLVRYDQPSGRWVEDGVAARVEDRYVAQVATLTSVGVAIFPDLGDACLRVEVDDNRLERPFHLRVDVAPSPTAPRTTALHTTITNQVTPIFGLPANWYAYLHVSPKSNPTKILATFSINTGGNVSPPNPSFPYSACRGSRVSVLLPKSTWLYWLGRGNETSALAYYQKIGAIPAKDTFQKWLVANGFESGFSANDVVFFNPNDLGLGRRLNCRMRKDAQGLNNVGCFVTKFGDVGGNPQEMLEDTIDRIAAGDTVAMEFTPGGLSTARNVKFFIYGPDGKLKTKTAFDTEGYNKYVPNVCMHCHGGTADFTQAKFVALDPHAYVFPSSGPYTRDAQQERFRQLNEMVAAAVRHQGPAWNLIESIYPSSGTTIGVHQPGMKARPQPVPESWRDAPEIWTKIVKPSCRTCHMHMGAPWDWGRSYDFESLGGFARAAICTGEMPNAMAPMLRLWRSSDPHLPDVFNDFYRTGRCGSGASNTRPGVAITAPADGAHVLYGGLNVVTLKATTFDNEDGSSCCNVDWLNDAGNVMGRGKELKYLFFAPGVQRLRAIAHDSAGTPSAADEITLSVDNAPPTVTVLSPLNDQILYVGAVYGFRATVQDPNLDMPCDRVIWSSPGEFNRTGCDITFNFRSLGQKTLTVTATDTQGAKAIVQKVVNVVEAPKNTPPVVAIAEPTTGAVLNPFLPTRVDGFASDPNGTEVPSVQWSVAAPRGGTEILLDTAHVFYWTPAASGITGCGNTRRTLVLEGTDRDGTTKTTREVTLAFPPCS